jgi:uncharacterized protein YecE (DUF72 family)
MVDMARFYCGTCGWNYPHWKSTFYAGVKQKDWLAYYSTRFDSVEINNSFYRLPESATFAKWRDSTPEGFVFAVKASRYLTHVKKLSEPHEPLRRLLDRSERLGDKRGPILYQFPPNWSIDLARLEAFLALLPSGVRHVFEFRNETWQVDAVWSVLERYGAAYCVMDSPGLPLQVRVTANFSYVRMHSGGERTSGRYTNKALATWAARLEQMLGRGDVYVYFNNDIHAYAVHNALTLRKMVLGN